MNRYIALLIHDPTGSLFTTRLPQSSCPGSRRSLVAGPDELPRRGPQKARLGSWSHPSSDEAQRRDLTPTVT